MSDDGKLSHAHTHTDIHTHTHTNNSCRNNSFNRRLNCAAHLGVFYLKLSHFYEVLSEGHNTPALEVGEF